MKRTVIVNLQVEATTGDDACLSRQIAQAVARWAQMPDVQSGTQPQKALIVHTPDEAPEVMVRIDATWRNA